MACMFSGMGMPAAARERAAISMCSTRSSRVAPASMPGFDIAVRYAACEAASGDTYDFTPLGDSRLAVSIGDVTGHGVGAALLTHAAQAALPTPLSSIPPTQQGIPAS